MLPLLLMTDNEIDMKGKRFENAVWVKICGWFSVIALTALNIKGLPDSIAGFFGDNPTPAQINLANTISYILIALIIALIAWTIVDMRKTEHNKLKRAAD